MVIFLILSVGQYILQLPLQAAAWLQNKSFDAEIAALIRAYYCRGMQKLVFPRRSKNTKHHYTGASAPFLNARRGMEFFSLRLH
jgi:hypothetical protein